MNSVSTRKLRITDTTLRDAHQSLIATRMRTDDMLPLAKAMDKIGLFSLEAWGGATFDCAMRYLAEDPWERLIKLKEVLKKTPIQMLLRGQNLVGYRHYPDDVVEKFVEAAARNGVDIFRVFDALNDIRNMKKSMEEVKNNSCHLQGAICYTISPVHDCNTFINMAKELYSLDCDSITIKDMAGLITPKDTIEIITGIKDEIDIPVCLHSHSTAGLAPMSYQAAIGAGVDILDTAMSPFALGTSQPPTESVVAAVSGTERDTGIDINDLREARNHCLKLREKYGALVDTVSETVDADVLIYQLPGGMISNMISQLKEQDAYDRLEEVLREVPNVRKDLGYPPLVTPTSQIVGTQAIFNVLVPGGRYANVTKEVKDYVLGLYGRPPKPIDEEIKRKIIGDAEVVTVRPADLLEPIYEKMKKEAEEMGIVKKPEDVLSYILYPTVAPSFLKGERKCELIVGKSISRAAGAPTMPTSMEVEVDGEVFNVRIISMNGNATEANNPEKSVPNDVKGAIKSNMTGMVLKVPVHHGDRVKKGDVLIILEAMKMENPIPSPYDGTVKEIFVDTGDTVQSGDVLMVVD
ncbi:MAG: pyruvate carboxylase subunit [Candidatus Methanomethylophilaceae archaeon]|nr:pyruvate carboxylase subunit [Candidatus Methanomethylophilaceae archaeon]